MFFPPLCVGRIMLHLPKPFSGFCSYGQRPNRNFRASFFMVQKS